MGLPSKASLNWGDQSENIGDKLIDENGFLIGTASHEYTLQGRYNLALKVWDKFSNQYSKSVEIYVRNDPLQFNIELEDGNNNAIIGYQVYENQEIFISVNDIYNFNEDLEWRRENFTFLYDFTNSEITSQEPCVRYVLENEGNYTLTVIIVDSQGTISRNSIPIEVINKPSKAKFTILSSRPKAQFKLRFSAESSTDTESDISTL